MNVKSYHISVPYIASAVDSIPKLEIIHANPSNQKRVRHRGCRICAGFATLSALSQPPSTTISFPFSHPENKTSIYYNMERPSTPPLRRATRANPVVSPPTPEVTRRIVYRPLQKLPSISLTSQQEANRLKAKALREQSIAREKAEATNPSLKRSATAISTAASTRDAIRVAPKDADILPARKSRKYVDHDLSNMVDTKGGFLSVEDDPFNKALHKPADDAQKPAHMTLKEWERNQLLKQLQRTKQGPYEPGISVLGGKDGGKCRECGSLEIDFLWREELRCEVCEGCKRKMPEKYSLLTKTEAKDDYLLTDRMASFPFPYSILYLKYLY
jgi:DNA-repair protein complementing XP-A cells